MKARRLEVISLYRQCLRSAQRCPSFDQQEFLRIYVRRKFKESTTIRDSALITHLLKEGVTELKTMESFHAARASREGNITTVESNSTRKETSEETIADERIVKSSKEDGDPQVSILNSKENGDPQVSIINNKVQMDQIMKRKLEAEMRLADAMARKAEAIARKAEAEAAFAEAEADLLELETSQKVEEIVVKKKK
jgi:hypothetical protein